MICCLRHDRGRGVAAAVVDDHDFPRVRLIGEIAHQRFEAGRDAFFLVVSGYDYGEERGRQWLVARRIQLKSVVEGVGRVLDG